MISMEGSAIPYSNLEETAHTGESEGGEIEVKIRKLDATEYIVSIEPNSSVLTLKQQIQDEHNDQVNLQRLICHGRELQDSQKLCDCNIENHSVIHLVMRQFVPEVPVAPDGNADAQSGVPHAVLNIAAPRAGGP